MQALISIISDWKNHDYYLAALKASILISVPDVRFIDVTHDIPAFNTQKAAFILRSTYKTFPEGTIHLMCVATEADSKNPHVIIEYKKQYFIGTDTDLFGMVFDNPPDKVIYIYPDSIEEQSTFPCLTVFSRIACFIIEGGDISLLGSQVEDVKRKTLLAPAIEPDSITGHIIYIDSYQNGITNISRQKFEQHVGNKKFDIYINSHFYHVNKVSNAYNEVGEGDLVVIFNSLDLLEIAIRNNEAATLLNLDKKTLITIRF